MWYGKVFSYERTLRGLPLAMSNQRSFKIGSFRFAAFVPKKNEYNSFWNKILDRNKTFSIRSRNFWSKTFRSGLFPNFFLRNTKFCFVFKKHWRNLKRFGFVLISFFKHTCVLFWFLISLEQTKTFQTDKKIWKLFTKDPFCLLWSLGVWKRFDLIIN